MMTNPVTAIKALPGKLAGFYKKRSLHKRMLREQAIEEYTVLKHISPERRSALSIEERREVENQWGKIDKTLTFREWEVFKYQNGFDSRYVGHHTYLPLIARRLNNYRYTKLFEHKSLLGYLTSSSVKFPECCMRCIDGEYYSPDMSQITKDEALKLCLQSEVMIVKDSVESSGGKSIEKIKLGGLNDSQKRECLMRVFDERPKDFVIQKCIRQHPVMAQFNPSSVNTIRVTSLYLNGRYTVCSICLRMGREGMTTDNLGSGGIIIGVNQNGQLADKGFDLSLNEYSGQNGLIFKGTQIPQLPSILKLIEEAHTRDFSLCKFIGWDVCISEDGTPIVIELNSSQPGLFGEQICHGPIFGDRTQEVIDYCLSKPFAY